MKLLYCSNSTLPSKTANSIHVMEMSYSFSKIIDQVILTGSVHKDTIYPDLYEYYGVGPNFKIFNISIINKSRFISWASALKCLLIALNFRPDFVYGRSLHSIFLLSLFGFKGGYESHSPENLSIINRYLFKSLLRNKRIKLIVTKSESLKKIISNEFGEKNCGKIVSLHDGARLNNLKENYLIEKYENKLNVGYIGHLYKGRGISLILNLAEALPDFFFHLIGGNIEDVEYWKEKSKNIPNLKIYGFIEPKYMGTVRQQMDILLAPYEKTVEVSGNRGDTGKYMSPLKIFEYMSASKPIITSNHEVLKEVLTNGENAMMISFDDFASWKNSLITLANDRKLRHKLGNNAFKKFSSEYSWDMRAQKIWSWLNER